MPGMFARLLKPPARSIFLIGPLGTGKSAWIREGLVGIEMKSTSDWLGRYGRGLSRLRDALAPAPVTCYGVFRGERPTISEETVVLPVRQFLNRLWQGEIIR